MRDLRRPPPRDRPRGRSGVIWLPKAELAFRLDDGGAPEKGRAGTRDLKPSLERRRGTAALARAARTRIARLVGSQGFWGEPCDVVHALSLTTRRRKSLCAGYCA